MRALVTNANTIFGIQRRAKDGKKISAASRVTSKRRTQRAQDPQIARRQALLGKAAHKAWDAEAGYPLGLYYLRGDVSHEQFLIGKWYAREAGFARKVIAAPKAEARTTNLGAKGKEASTYTPSARDIRRSGCFLERDQELRQDWPVAWQALRLCVVEDLWHQPEKRETKPERPAYSLGALVEALEEVGRWR